MKAKILVVGGGVAGASIAQRAARQSDPIEGPVVLCERKSMGCGTNWPGGAILRQLTADRVLAAMTRDSFREYAAFESRSGRSIGFRRTGVLSLIGPDQGSVIQGFRETCEELSEMGIRLEVVDSDRMRRLFPGLHFRRGSVGIWERDGGFVDPRRTIQAFAALARNYGAVTRLGVTVTDIHTTGERVTAVSTTEGDYRVEKVVLAAGPHCAELLSRLGVEIPLRVLRPETYLLRMPASETADVTVEQPTELGFNIAGDLDRSDDPTINVDEYEEPGLHPVLIDLETGFYCCGEPQTGRSRVGRLEYDLGATSKAPEGAGDGPREDSGEWARAAFERRLPDQADRECIDPIEGLYTLTPDSKPIIGPVPGIDGLYVATGLSGHGFKLAPALGEGMAQMLAGQSVSAFDPEAFSLDRFSGDEKWEGTFDS